MEIPEIRRRDILLSNEISQASVKDAIREIFDINEDDKEKDKIYKNWNKPPILLYINSFGGSVYDGLALFDVIRNSRTPVHTIAIGSCMSMGLWIWLAGKKRFVGKNSTLMFHDISSVYVGKTEEIKQDLTEGLRLQRLLINEITSTSAITEDKLKDYISRKAEWYITSQEAIDLKLADGYYKSR